MLCPIHAHSTSSQSLCIVESVSILIKCHSFMPLRMRSQQLDQNRKFNYVGLFRSYRKFIESSYKQFCGILHRLMKRICSATRTAHAQFYQRKMAQWKRYGKCVNRKGDKCKVNENRDSGNSPHSVNFE